MDVDKARLALAEAKAELAKLEAAGKAKNGTGGQGPPPDIRLPPMRPGPSLPPPIFSAPGAEAAAASADLPPGAAGGSPAGASGAGGPAARGSQASKHDKEIARLKLESAERLLKRVEARYKAGDASYDEYLKAVLARDVVATELKGDAVAAAQ